MHVRSSTVRGMSILDDQTQVIAGYIDDPLIDPDSGRIEGFFVVPAFSLSGRDLLFLPSIDIIGWGTKVHIRSVDVLAPPEELVRLQKLLADPRRFLGQQIMVQGTLSRLGICKDIQFDTRHFSVDWLFPRRYIFQRTPIPASEILEVTTQAIIVREPLRPTKDELSQEAQPDAKGVLPDVLPVAQGRVR